MIKKRQIFKLLLIRISKVYIRYFIDFFGFSVGFFISTLISFFISILLNKNLSKSELGEFSYYKTIFEFIAYLLTLTVYRSYLRFNINGVSIVLSRLVRKLTVFSIVILIGIIYFLTKNWIVPLFAFFIIYEERLYFARSLMDIKSLNLLRIGASLTTLAVLFLFINSNALTSDEALAAYGVGFLISFIFLKGKNKQDNDIGKLDVRRILLFSVPGLGAILVKWSLDGSVQILLKEYFDFAQLSLYAIAIRVLTIIRLFSSLFLMFFPVVYYREIQKKNKKFIDRLRWSMTLFILLISIISFIFSEELYSLMGASDYIEHIYIFRILIIAELFFIVGNFWGTFLAYALKTHITLMIYFTGALTNIIFLLLTLKNNGVVFAAYSVLIANFIIMILLILFSLKKERQYLSSKLDVY